MNITYIYHSSFLIETERCYLLFDYYKGTLPVLKPEKALFVLASHKHQDHFSAKIFELAKDRDNICFILSEDISLKSVDNHLKEKITFVPAGIKALEIKELISGNSIWLETLESTDEGVAFIVTVKESKELTIYHAGDLNWWTWEGEETKEEYEDMTRRFQSQIKKLEGRKFDAAFLPLDPRQGSRYWWGLNAFMQAADARLIYPMHMWEEYDIIKKMKRRPEAAAYSDRIQDDFYSI